MTSFGFTAPHAEASKAGMGVLERGGSAVDAMLAAAAMIAVQYPHMNSLGGDSFWIIQEKGKQPLAIDGCGYAAKNATQAYYSADASAIPERGPKAALTMAGTLGAWQCAREVSESKNQIPLRDLFQPAIEAASQGIIVTESLNEALQKCVPIFKSFENFNRIFSPASTIYNVGDKIQNPGLAQLLVDLSVQGLDSFYRGKIAEKLAADLSSAGSPISIEDFNAYKALVCDPLSIKTSNATLYNFDAPTQGIASLLILAIYDRLYQSTWTEPEIIHHIVEATKQAFLIRDKYVVDPKLVDQAWGALLDDRHVNELASKVASDSAMLWPKDASHGDTVWMGAVDKDGTMVSFIQSLYWEFGSGLVLPSYGLVWNNRGVSFSLDSDDPNVLAPMKKPRHTLNPALAVFDSGDRMVYGSMGGEGQPQTQAALFTRHVYQGYSLEDAISEPRWLLGRTWGDQSTNLKIESSLYEKVAHSLQELGHELERVDDRVELMGHAGAIRLYDNGRVEAASDIRSDGLALTKRLS